MRQIPPASRQRESSRSNHASRFLLGSVFLLLLSHETTLANESLLIGLPDDQPFDPVIDALRTQCGAIGSLIAVSLLTTISAWFMKRISGLKKRLAGPRFNLPLKSEERINRVLLVGIGGSGKTTFIRSVTNHPDANPRIKTGSVKTYSMVHELTTGGTSIVNRIDVDDYRGQNFGDVVGENMLRAAKGDLTPINSIVIIVDTIPPPNREHQVPDITNQVVLARVAENIDAWNDQILDTLFSLAKGRIEYLCLFVNKADILTRRPFHLWKPILLRLYDPLIQKIRPRTDDILFETFVGSAENEIAVGCVRTALLNHAVPLKEKK